MTRRYGRSPVGQRLVCPVPQGHYQTTTMIAAVRLQGPQAPWLFEGPMDGELFLAWVKQGLVPVLQRDDVVILDNLSTHKVAGVLEAIEAAGARLEYLPPYSPDFNPTENLWSKVKQGLKSRDPRGNVLTDCALWGKPTIQKPSPLVLLSPLQVNTTIPADRTSKTI